MPDTVEIRERGKKVPIFVDLIFISSFISNTSVGLSDKFRDPRNSFRKCKLVKSSSPLPHLKKKFYLNTIFVM